MILKMYKTTETALKCKTRVGGKNWTSKGEEEKKNLQPEGDREIAPIKECTREQNKRPSTC